MWKVPGGTWSEGGTVTVRYNVPVDSPGTPPEPPPYRGLPAMAPEQHPAPAETWRPMSGLCVAAFILALVLGVAAFLTLWPGVLLPLLLAIVALFTVDGAVRRGRAFEAHDSPIDCFTTVARDQPDVRAAHAVVALAPVERIGRGIPHGHRVREDGQRVFRVVLPVSLGALEPCRAERVVRQRPERRIGVSRVHLECFTVVLDRLFDVVGLFLFDALAEGGPEVVLRPRPHVGIGVARPDVGRGCGVRDRAFDVLASPRAERLAKHVADVVMTGCAFVGISTVRQLVHPC